MARPALKPEAVALALPPPTGERAVAEQPPSDAEPGHDAGVVDAAHREVRLETLQLLFSSRHRTKTRLAESASRGRGLTHASLSQAARQSPRAESLNLPALTLESELRPSSSRTVTAKAPRPPAQSRSTPSSTSRPATSAAKTVPTRGRGEAAGFFSRAVMEAAQIRHLQLPSRIPQEMWVFESTPFSTNATQAPNAPEEVLQSYDGHTGSASFQRRVFPRGPAGVTRGTWSALPSVLMRCCAVRCPTSPCCRQRVLLHAARSRRRATHPR
jgi:hypothetical protein